MRLNLLSSWYSMGLFDLQHKSNCLIFDLKNDIGTGQNKGQGTAQEPKWL